MSNLLWPAIAHETVPAPPLTAAALAVPVAWVLAWHHLPTVQNVRVVWLAWPLTDALTGQNPVGLSLARVGGQPYYRLVSKAVDGQVTVQYRSTRDGQLLPDGEFRYAAELGQEFMAKLTTTVPGAASATNSEGLSAAADYCEAPSRRARGGASQSA